MNTLLAFINEIDISASNSGGDCYEAAGKYMMDQCMNNDCNLILVHGEVGGQGALSGTRYGHAWVEQGGTIIDKSNGRNLQMPKAIYYAIGAIASPDMSKWGTPGSLDDPDLFSGGNLHKYTWEEAREKIIESGHWGPWDLVTSSGL